MSKLRERLSSSNERIVIIETNPRKVSSVRVKMQSVSMNGTEISYTLDEKGNKIINKSYRDVKNLQRLPGTIVQYTARIDDQNGKLITGLDKYVPNDFIDEDFYRPGWEKILKGKKKIRLQELLEYKHNKPQGYYTSEVSGIIKSNIDENTPFYQRSESRVNLNDGITILNLDNPVHEVNYYMLLEHNMVANSFEDLEFNPNATHYIVDIDAEVKREADDIRKTNKFGAALEHVMSMEYNNLVNQFAKALFIDKGYTTKEQAYNAINSYVLKGSGNYDTFMTLYEMWKNPVTREKFVAYSDLFDFQNVPDLIVMRNNKIFWNQPIDDSGQRQIWEWKSKEDFINNFLLAPQYSEEVEQLRRQYAAKSRN